MPIFEDIDFMEKRIDRKETINILPKRKVRSNEPVVIRIPIPVLPKIKETKENEKLTKEKI
jgi:hypothetical protein